MIIYGTRAANIKTAQAPNIACPNCGTKDSIFMYVFRRHAHIFWIPLFPIGRKGFSECSHCKQGLTVKQMPKDMRREYDKINRDARGPLWQFAGLLIIAFVVVAAAISASIDKNNSKKYISAPETDDVYKYKTESGNYSTLKVIAAKDDSIWFLENEYEVSKKSEINKIDKAENYSEDIYAIDQKSLQEMFDEKKIYSVIRQKK